MPRSRSPVRRDILLTGRPGTGQESASAARLCALARRRPRLPEDVHEKLDLHIHYPATPSRRTVRALASPWPPPWLAPTRRPVRHDHDGEAPSAGSAAIGGLRAEVCCAPRRDRDDLGPMPTHDRLKIPTNVREHTAIIGVDMSEVLHHALLTYTREFHLSRDRSPDRTRD